MGQRPHRHQTLPYWKNGPAFTADAEALAEYDQLLKRLNDSDLAYLHLLGPEPDTGTDDTFTAFTRYRTHYHGAVIANLGFTQATGNELLERQLADAVSFGAPSSPIQTSSIDSPTAIHSPPATATRTTRVTRGDTRTTPP
ncbi:hypothetical protein NKH77_52280 [Streptomyces sp. M19]